MHQRPYTHRKKNVKSSRLLALVAACVVLTLSFSIVSILLHKKKSHYTNKVLSLPEETHADIEPRDKTTKKNNWTVITTRPGDSLASVFKQVGLSQQTLLAILHDNPHAKHLSGIKPNQQIQFLIRHGVLEQLIMSLNTTQTLTVSRKDKQYISHISLREMSRHREYSTATVRGSLFGTAQRSKIPYKLVKQMTDIFNWEIDFSKEVKTGDQFSILYDAFYIDDKLVNTGDILAVTYRSRGKVHQAVRHMSSSGDFDYFTPNGVSLKKAFSRYPIQFSHISSTFSLSRKHPILHYARPHKGVDLAAPIGTPIHATGDGIIQSIGRQSDYGNMVKLSHSKTYSSIYGHLLRFQKGLSKGDRVKRGQIIGYVGQTGLATGPHCHYEFHVNHQPKNPTTIELPRAAPISARDMAAFKAQAQLAIARLKLFEEGNLIGSADKKSSATG
jgi:murein DD-endopeptidase MepM/ murein hydrolase activator NlpD